MGKRLDDLMKKQEQINKQIETLQKQEAETQRKEDTRRKVLIGAAILDAIEKKEWSDAQLKALMSKFLIRSTDRKLFGLPAIESSDRTLRKKSES